LLNPFTQNLQHRQITTSFVCLQAINPRYNCKAAILLWNLPAVCSNKSKLLWKLPAVCSNKSNLLWNLPAVCSDKSNLLWNLPAVCSNKSK